MQHTSGTYDRAPSRCDAPWYPAPQGGRPHDVLDAYARACESFGTVMSAHLWIEDANSRTVRLVSAAGRFRPSPEPVPIEGTTLGSAVTRGRAVLAREFEATVSGEKRCVWRHAVPIESGALRGVAALDIAGDENGLRALTDVAGYYRPLLACALDALVAREESDVATVVVGAARKLSALSDSDEVSGLLLQWAIEIAEADTGSVMLLDEEGALRIVASSGLPEEIVGATRVTAGEGIAGWVLATGQTVIVEDLEERSGGQRHDVRSALSVPIADDRGVVGVLNVGAKRFRARPQPPIAHGLETLARIGAASLRIEEPSEASRAICLDTLKALARATDAERPDTAESVERLLAVVDDLATELGMTERELDALRIAALLHDIGMPVTGAEGPGLDRPLTTVEWGMVKTHPIIAARALEGVAALEDVAPIVLHHHERFDGSGYVGGLSGEEIPWLARILAVADAFVAMTSYRPYRPPMAPAEAIGVLESNAGTQFDPSVVETLAKIAGDRDGWVVAGAL